MKVKLKRDLHFSDGSGIHVLEAKKGSLWDLEPATNLPVPTDGTTRWWGVPRLTKAEQKSSDLYWLATEGIGCLIDLPEDAVEVKKK